MTDLQPDTERQADQETTQALRELIARELTGARERTSLLTDCVDETDLIRQHSPLMSPLVWDLAHIANQEELWLLREVAAVTLPAAALDLTNATVVSPPALSAPEAKAVTLLIEEVEKRSGIRWETSPAAAPAPVAVFQRAPRPPKRTRSRGQSHRPPARPVRLPAAGATGPWPGGPERGATQSNGTSI